MGCCHNHNHDHNEEEDNKKNTNGDMNNHNECDHKEDNEESVHLDKTQKEHEHNHTGHNHGWMMILCVLPILIYIIYKYIKGDNAESNNWWIYLMLILCPLSHIFMMRGGHKHNKNDKDESINKEEE